MDALEQIRRLRDEYEAALDEAERARRAYHRGIVELHRSGVSLREIAEGLGLSHQRVHQIVSPGPPRTGRAARPAGAAAAIAALLLLPGLGFIVGRSHGEPSTRVAGSPAPSTASTQVLTLAACAGGSRRLSPLAMAACAGGRTDRQSIVVLDPRTGRIVAVGSTGGSLAVDGLVLSSGPPTPGLPTPGPATSRP